MKSRTKNKKNREQKDTSGFVSVSVFAAHVALSPALNFGKL
jgi:hypothetical protein